LLNAVNPKMIGDLAGRSWMMLRRLWLDNPLTSAMLFFPVKSLPGTSLLADTHDGVIPLGDVDIGYRLYVKVNASSLLFWFHGNAETAADYDIQASLLREIGLALLVVDYRGYGWSSGRPRATTLLSDAEDVFRRLPAILAQHSMSELPLFVAGLSLGGAPAIHLASKYPKHLKGVILQSTFAHGPSILGKAFAWLPGLFDNRRKIAQLPLPLLVIHGERDRIIPVGQGQVLFDRSPAQHKVLMLVPGAGHNDLVTKASARYLAAIKKFVDDVLNAKS
jgi:pimeloyl-ACP methyl ester carboxylesterase